MPKTTNCFADYGVTVLEWPAKWPDRNPIENQRAIVERMMRDTGPNNTDELKAAFQATWASRTPQQCQRLITSMQ